MRKCVNAPIFLVEYHFGHQRRWPSHISDYVIRTTYYVALNTKQGGTPSLASAENNFHVYHPKGQKTKTHSLILLTGTHVNTLTQRSKEVIRDTKEKKETKKMSMVGEELRDRSITISSQMRKLWKNFRRYLLNRAYCLMRDCVRSCFKAFSPRPHFVKKITK